jgi:uncharacterized protein YjbI with pentapeptide repeats
MLEIKDRHGRTVFRFPHLSSKDFDGADLRNINLKGGILEGADFSDANLEGACLEACDLYWARFFRARLKNANLRSALLMGCEFTKADLSGADLSDANLGVDSLGGSTHIEGANLSNCVVAGTTFSGVVYDAATILPVGLDPDAHKMIKA